MIRRDTSMHDSLWYATAAPAPATPPLDGDAQADVAIIGAGFTGCSTALHLAQAGARPIVLEAAEPGWGGSGRNVGLVNAGTWLDPDDVVKRAGREHGERLMAGLDAAPGLVFDLVERYAMNVDLVRKGVIKVAHSAGGMKGLEAHVAQWQSRGANIELVDRARMESLTGIARQHGGLIDHRSASIQPLSYARELARAAIAEGARIHASTEVTKLEPVGGGWRVETPRGTVTAERVVLATNAFPTRDLWPGIQASVIPVGCFGYATDPLGHNVRSGVLPGGHATYDTQPAMNFARLDRDGRLLVGSLGYLPRSNDARPSAWANRALRRMFPQLAGTPFRFRWSGTLGFTPDHITRLHEPAPGLHMVVGFNGRGIAPGTFWGRILARRVLGDLPDDELPLPPTPVRPIATRGLWAAYYETAFSAYRLTNLGS